MVRTPYSKNSRFFSNFQTNPIISNTSNSSSIDTPNSFDNEKEVSSKSNKKYQYPFDNDIAEKKLLVALSQDSIVLLN